MTVGTKTNNKREFLSLFLHDYSRVLTTRLWFPRLENKKVLAYSYILWYIIIVKGSPLKENDMKIRRQIRLTKEEQQHFEWVINWYNKNLAILENYGIDGHVDLYNVLVYLTEENEAD